MHNSSTKRPAKPAVSILNPAFRYRPSHATDVRETFARVRRDLEAARGERRDAVNVVRLRREESR